MLSTAELRARKQERSDAFTLGWNDSFHRVKRNPFSSKLDKSLYNAYERGFQDGSTKGLAPIPVRRSVA